MRVKLVAVGRRSVGFHLSKKLSEAALTASAGWQFVQKSKATFFEVVINSRAHLFSEVVFDTDCDPLDATL